MDSGRATLHEKPYLVPNSVLAQRGEIGRETLKSFGPPRESWELERQREPAVVMPDYWPTQNGAMKVVGQSDVANTSDSDDRTKQTDGPILLPRLLKLVEIGEIGQMSKLCGNGIGKHRNVTIRLSAFWDTPASGAQFFVRRFGITPHDAHPGMSQQLP
eukprot:1492606-Rhodomonas_salina.3